MAIEIRMMKRMITAFSIRKRRSLFISAPSFYGSRHTGSCRWKR
jgi:hypothetical protein